MEKVTYKLWAVCGAMFTLLTLLFAVLGSSEFNVSMTIGVLGFVSLTCYFAWKAITTPE